MRRLKLGFLIAALACGLSGTAQAQMGTIRFDNWLFYQENFNDSARWQYRPRFFIPFALGDGWTFTQRIDIPMYYTDRTGPENPDGGWKFGLSDVFIEEILDTPDVAKNFRLRTSLRLVFPTGGASPFGSDQSQAALGAGFNWRLPDVGHGVTVAPYLRYFYGFNESSGVTTTRRLDIFPSVDVKLEEKWTLAFYPEQGMAYNYRSKKWFVPIEAMIVNQPAKSWAWAVGGAYPLIDDDQSYRWLLQSRLTFFF